MLSSCDVSVGFFKVSVGLPSGWVLGLSSKCWAPVRESVGRRDGVFLRQYIPVPLHNTSALLNVLLNMVSPVASWRTAHVQHWSALFNFAGGVGRQGVDRGWVETYSSSGRITTSFPGKSPGNEVGRITKSAWCSFLLSTRKKIPRLADCFCCELGVYLLQ